MVFIPLSDFEIDAWAIETRPTRFADALLRHPLTIEIYRPLEGIRVAWEMAKVYGDWFAIGDVIQTREDYADIHALPGKFRFTGFFEFLPGTILNVGTCNPLFDRPGMGYQAEFLDGPLPSASLSKASWVNYSGNA